jgi:hypothetical protein
MHKKVLFIENAIDGEPHPQTKGSINGATDRRAPDPIL